MPKREYEEGEVIWLSKEIYDKKIRALMSEEDFGLFVAIEVDSGDFETDWRVADAIHRLRERNPEGSFTAQRVGYSTPISMGYHEKPSLDKPALEESTKKGRTID